MGLTLGRLKFILVFLLNHWDAELRRNIIGSSFLIWLLCFKELSDLVSLAPELIISALSLRGNLRISTDSLEETIKIIMVTGHNLKIRHWENLNIPVWLAVIVCFGEWLLLHLTINVSGLFVWVIRRWSRWIAKFNLFSLFLLVENHLNVFLFLLKRPLFVSGCHHYIWYDK